MKQTVKHIHQGLRVYPTPPGNDFYFLLFLVPFKNIFSFLLVHVLD